ncbi:MAG: CDP-alcohol phosphatidyltransferase family protein [Pseudomonadota bacterium]
MFDSYLRPLIDPPLNTVAAKLPISADQMTVLGLVAGILAALAIVAGGFWLALALILLNRCADGLDGPLARHHGASPVGGYLDIVFDFIFYGAIPLAFALHDPANALPAAVLLASFYMNGATFLAFSAVAAERGLSTEAQGKKSIYYFAGVAEGFETIAVFCAMCLFPSAFWWLAYGFAALCFVSASARIIMVKQTLRAPP